MMFPKSKPIKSKKLRDSAKGQDCLIRIPGVCNWNSDTTVLAHLGGGGMGIKRMDHEASFSCYNCHQVIDGAAKSEYSHHEIKLFHFEGVMRTQKIWIQMGLIKITE